MFALQSGVAAAGTHLRLFLQASALYRRTRSLAAVQGYLADDLNPIERLLLVAVPFLIIYPTMISNLIGAGIVIAVYAKQKGFGKNKNKLEGGTV